MNKMRELIIVLSLSFLFFGCVATVDQNNTNATAQNATNTTIANPASLYCVNHGGKSTIVTNPDGSQGGVCVLQNGTKCDEWAYYRGECPAVTKWYQLSIDGSLAKNESDWNSSHVIRDMAASIRANPGKKVEGKYNGSSIIMSGNAYELYFDAKQVKNGNLTLWKEWDAIQDYREEMDKHPGIEMTALYNGTPLDYITSVEVMGVFFVPSGMRDPTVQEKTDLSRHLSLAQSRYTEMLKGRDTFKISNLSPTVYHSPNNLTYFKYGDNEGTGRVAFEMMSYLNATRSNMHYVLLIIMIDPEERYPTGSASPINGRIGYGGGMVFMSVYELNNRIDKQYASFQSTVQHEMSHAFGLPHIDVYGYDMNTSDSIMSYNPTHHWDGFIPPAKQGIFIPEDIRGLAMNKLVFSNLYFDPKIDVPAGYDLKEQITLGAMSFSTERTGYQLFFDGQMVGHESDWNGNQAVANLAGNIKKYPDKKVTGKYGNHDIIIEGTGYELYFDGQRVGHEPNWTYEEGTYNLRANRHDQPSKDIAGLYNGEVMNIG